MSTATASPIESVLVENRVFPPPAEFSRRSRIGSLDVGDCVAALRACAEKDGLEWRLLKTLTRALSQATLMLQKNTATRCYHITA
jgi:hypothetical protein